MLNNHVVMGQNTVEYSLWKIKNWLKQSIKMYKNL